jgi:hypothetical protein
MTEHDIARESKLPERLRAFDDLRDRLETLTQRSELLGMEVHAIVEQSGHQIYKQPNEAVFGASLGKLPLAIMAMENLEPHIPLEIDDLHGVTPGVTAAELLEKMLKKSDNVSYRVLAELLGGPAAINDFYDTKGWTQTRVIGAPSGRAQLAETTAAESLSQLKYILGTSSQNELADVARQALSEQEVNRHGIRQLKIDDPNVHIFNKTGEYNGDPHDPAIFRHDVGSILGRDGRLNYAVMTAISHHNPMPTLAKKLLADSTIKQFGAELVEYVGGTVNRSLGVQAVRGLINRS